MVSIRDDGTYDEEPFNVEFMIGNYCSHKSGRWVEIIHREGGGVSTILTSKSG